MKAALFLFVALSANAVHAAPTITSYQFNCQYKPNVDGGWNATSGANPFMSGNVLHVSFNGSAMGNIETTNTNGEYRVEGRCPGTITLSDNKPFKIRDFAWDEEFADIGNAKDGKIDLFAKGQALIPNTNQADGFEKSWTIRKNKLDSYNNESDTAKKAKMNPFGSQAETQTLCSNQLTLRFDDLRGLVERNQTDNIDEREGTSISLVDLLINIDPC